MERRIFMRQVISRFLKHLEAEKNASATTIEAYQYDLHKFDVYLVKRLGKDSCREMSPKTIYGIILDGSQKSVIKGRTAPRLVHDRLPPYGHFSSMPIERAS